MNLNLLTFLAWISAVSLVSAEDKPSNFDVEAAKVKLAQPVEKSSGKFTPKGLNPEVKRFYSKDAVVITRQSGATETHPFVEVPLLFQVNTDQLRDGVSEANLAKVALMLKELGVQSATFAIEGHASAEGDAGRNRELSSLRALRIQSLLREQGVPAGVVVRTEGFGSDHAEHPIHSPEALLGQDRRVLVVRQK